MDNSVIEAIERLEDSIEAMWAAHGETVTFPSSGTMTLVERIDACTAEIEAGN